MRRSRLVLALVACVLLGTAAFVRAESAEAEFELEAETAAEGNAELYPGDLDLRLNGLRSIEQAQAQAELNQIKVCGRIATSALSLVGGVAACQYMRLCVVISIRCR